MSGAGVADPPRSDAPGAGDRADRRWEQPVWAATHSEGRALPGVGGSGDAPHGRPTSRRWVVWSAVLASATVVGLLALGVAVEVWGRGYMAEQVEAQLRASGITGDIEVSTVGGWRPVVLPALVGRGLEELHIAISDGTIAGMPVVRADYVLHDIDGDVSLRTGQVRVRSIGSGRVRIEIDVADIADAIGAGLAVGDGRLVTTEGVGVDVSVEDEALVLGGPAVEVWGAPVKLPIIDDYLLPCTPRVAFRPDTLVLSCTGSRLPGVLGDPLALAVDPDVAPVGSLLPPQSTIVNDDPSVAGTEVPATDGTTTVPSTQPPPTEPPPTVPPVTDPLVAVPVDPAAPVPAPPPG